MNMYNQPWIGRSMTITSSTDPTLTGRTGIVVDETRNTVALLEGDQQLVLNKASITFTVDDNDVVIQGAMVGQRPEDRIHRTYRKA
ncbi:MAG: ribonuclease P protein subunit [Candidatus Thermoplasmatota archaeon]|jgi:RNase P/RNase MRP subunit p29|nr:ribonuclease P protein subunit [Candidatus Thermoplasmatota archaeon]MEC8763748.1 ribonuclease P protein subunit [Candidatus Thermoplasmatota archaeon]